MDGCYMGEFIALLFMARDITHREHLKTKSYAQHMALGEFYPAIIEFADKIAEAYQGCEGKLITIPQIKNTANGSVDSILRSHLAWIEKNRKNLSDESSIQNIVDEIVGLYQTTLYKLKFLS